VVDAVHSMDAGRLSVDDASPPVLRVCTLGALQVEVKGEIVPIARPIERLVLGVLATARGVFVDLIDVAPPDRDRSAARRALATTIWRLRQTLGVAGDAVLVSGRPARYALDPETTTFATVEFDTLRRRGRDLLLGDDASGAAQALTEAIALWRGDALADLGDHRVIRAERVYLDELRAGALEDLATALVRAGRPTDALAMLDRLLRDQPLHEQAWALRIQAMLAAGHRDDAARAFDEARARLADIGLEPGLALRRAADTLMPAPPPASWTPVARQPGAIVQLPGPFVGRDLEVARLVDLVDAPRANSCLALVLGGPGAGKTRLAAEVAARVGTARPVYFLPISRDARDPFGPLAELARMVMADAPPDVRSDPETARLLDPSDPVMQPSEVVATDAQAAFVDRLVDLIRASCPRGALLVIDDAHTASAPMLGLLRRLTVGDVARPVTVLALVRTPVRATDVLATAQQLAVAVIHLAGFDSGDIKELAVSLLAGDVDEPTVRWIEEQTAGNPLFVAVLLQDAEVRRALAAGRLPERRDGLTHAVARFLAGFEGTDREVLRAAAFLGPGTFDRALLTEVGAARGLSNTDVGRAIDHAIDESVVVVDPGTIDSFIFRHGLIRDALADEVELSDRPAWHRACAVVIERRAAQDPALVHAVAAHHARAWPHTTAVDAATWLMSSAAAMSRLADHAAAAAQLETAATLLARDPDAPARLAVHVQLALARARIDLNDQERAFTAIRAAAHVARRAGWPDGLAMAGIRGADVVDPGRLWREELEALLAEALGPEQPLDVRLRGQALTALGYLRPALADRLTADAVERARQSGSHADLATLLIELWPTTDTARQLAVAEEIAELGESIGSAHIEAIGLLRRWMCEIRVGRATFVEPVADRLARLVDEAADPLLDWSWLSWSAVRAIAIGEFDRADELLTRLLRLPMHLGRKPLAPPASRLLSLTAAQRGLMGFLRNDPSAMQYAVRAAAANWSIAGLDQRWFSSLRHATDGPAFAQPSLDDLTSGLRAMVRATPERVLAAALLGDGAAPAGHRPGIDAAREVMLQHTGEHLIYDHVYFGTVDQHLGWIDLYTGEWDAAVRWLESGLVQLHAVGSPPFIVRINRNLAAALRGRGDRGDLERAEQLDTEAAELAERLGVLGGTYRPPLSQE
jgi:DNA-binding SARP family transcriptional activator